MNDRFKVDATSAHVHNFSAARLHTPAVMLHAESTTYQGRNVSHSVCNRMRSGSINALFLPFPASANRWKHSIHYTCNSCRFVPR